MPLKPKFCTQCGQPVITRDVVGTPRVVCPSCETIHYENPLPVAAALVLNERREVLLVRRARPPHKGQWCLPMGFAEMGETIADAAARELKEEAGIDARTLRLLTTHSTGSDHYGDLLIVTFEMEKAGGVEQAGDDADDVRYFPLGTHPPLAFESNENALHACAAAHLEAWEMHDSFVRLQAEQDQGLLADTLIAAIEEGAKDIAAGWLDEVRQNPTTQRYRELAPDGLVNNATLAVSHFGCWFKDPATDQEVKEFYRQVAHERKRQGFLAHEVLSSLSLLKKQVWHYARAQSTVESPLDIYRMLEFNRLMALFFDKATYHLVRTFEAGESP
jgi:ADP-ribose pyrophosphatase YjhB (NUDIX family)